MNIIKITFLKRHFILISCSLIFAACNNTSNENRKKSESEFTRTTINIPTIVETKISENKPFYYELISNGTLSAMRKADLRFQTSEIVSEIFVKNGDYVTKGQKLAVLEQFKLKNALAHAKDNLEKAKLELQDILIGQGFSLADSSQIPPKIMKIAKIKSNYDQSMNNYKEAEYNLKASTLYAPFSGVVANLFTKPYNIPSGSEPFCTIIDNQKPEAIFMILESELPIIKNGDKVVISPFSIENYSVEGRISEINPIIDKNGMVRVKALISNKQGKLYDGMNIKVKVQKEMGNYLQIPKEAVVLRNNKQIVFTLKNNRAQWNYVKTGMENSENYIISEGLSVGDSVIYKGNINLAHGTPVVSAKRKLGSNKNN